MFIFRINIYIINYIVQSTSWIENKSLKSQCCASVADFELNYIGKIFKINKNRLVLQPQGSADSFNACWNDGWLSLWKLGSK